MSNQLVPISSISEATLHIHKPLFARYTVWPFVFLYPLFAYLYTVDYDRFIGGPEWTRVFLVLLGSLHVLTFLMPYWNVEVQKHFLTLPAESIAEADLIRIVPASSNGVSEIVPIHRNEVETWFVFQKRKFILNEESGSFTPPRFAVDGDVKLETFQSSKGLRDADLDELVDTYGPNKFDIPVPTITELFKEHAVAPFFVFQIFCVGLWLMDEQWYYSIFTLVMLVGFEWSQVFQRQRTMMEFRGMGVKPYAINVYRNNKWVELQTDDLLPGDVVSITRSPEESGLPCDFVLAHGTAIVNEAMLSGESTPLLKESIELRPGNELFQPDGLDRNSLLYGGTKVLQVTPSPNKTRSAVPAPPDGGAIAIVTRTGFETSQGSLVRVMIFSTERVGAGNKEAYFFILFLLIFAIAASYYVWTEGVRVDRERSKLILDCVIIITSVVPPELPMELTLAVNSSLSALGKHYIFCTEPFRIPFAGRIDVACFDKTGTLTDEDLVVEGVAGLGSDMKHLHEPSDLPLDTTLLLGSAHALVLLDDGEVVGDPMEKNTLKELKWTVDKNDVCYNSQKPSQKVRILRRFQFSSALKRSSTVASTDGKTLVAVKGAPETIRTMLTSVPDQYEETYKSFTRSGSRVLALGYKYIDTKTSQVNDLSRESVESGLKFGGFLVFSCPLKSDAVETVKMLNESSHRVVMITGDNPLTAVHVAKEVGIVERQTLILDLPEDGKHELVWHSVDDVTVIPVTSKEPIKVELFKDYDLCITGYALAKLSDHDDILHLLKHTWVYARVSPTQKEFILSTLKDAGYTTMMCGDGTNDVGALKQAHVGVALLNGTEEGMKKIAENNKIEAAKKVYDKQAEMMIRWGGKPPPVPAVIAHLYPPGPSNPRYLEALEKKGIDITHEILDNVKKAYKEQGTSQKAAEGASGFAAKMTEMMEEADGDEAPALKLGDASVAAPLTSKLSNVGAVIHIVRQGRCTLVATIQMYKILALNCLISAYNLSVLFFAGIKFGDGQSTVSGMLLSVCFLSISRAKAIEKLSKERPQPGIFNIYIMGSILGQFAVHILTLIYVTSKVYENEPKPEKIDLEAKFEPSLLNTAIYLLNLAQQISTFAVNYQGRPFRQSIRENTGMFYGLLGVGGLALVGATEYMPEINESLSLVKMPDLFKFQLCAAMAFDLVVTWVIEKTLKFFFMDYKAKDIAVRTEDREEIILKKKTQ